MQNMRKVNPYKYKPHPRFVKWSEVMNNLLCDIYPEVEEFDFGISEDGEMSEDRSDLYSFLEVVWALRSPTGFVPNEVLYLIAQHHFGRNSGMCKNKRTILQFLDGNKKILNDIFRIKKTDRPEKYHNRTHRGFVFTGLSIPDHIFTTKPQLQAMYIERLKDNSDTKLEEFDFV